MATKELFQQALLKYSGTILIVSHDRYFLDNLVSRVIEIRDSRIYDYLGNYSYFIEKRAQLLAESEDYASSIKKAKKLKLRAKTLDKLKKRNRIYRQKKDFQDKLKSVEEKIKILKENKANIEAQLCDPIVLKDSKKVQNLMINLKKYNQKIETLTKTREELILKIKELY